MKNNGKATLKICSRTVFIFNYYPGNNCEREEKYTHYKDSTVQLRICMVCNTLVRMSAGQSLWAGEKPPNQLPKPLNLTSHED